MKLKYIFWSINIIFEFIFSLYHEFWHWLFGTILWFFDNKIIDRPILRVDKYPYCELNDIGGLTSYAVCMSVMYTSNGPYRFSKLISFAPAIGCIFLFIVSPLYMYLLYIPYINTIWLSIGDVRQLKGEKLSYNEI